MKRLLKTAVLVLLLALVPLRGFAAATVGLCATESAQADSVQSAADQDSRMPGPHTHDGKPDCSACAEHCTSLLVVLSAERMSLPGDIETARTTHGERLVAGFIPEHLDPPPLAR